MRLMINHRHKAREAAALDPPVPANAASPHPTILARGQAASNRFAYLDSESGSHRSPGASVARHRLQTSPHPWPPHDRRETVDTSQFDSVSQIAPPQSAPGLLRITYSAPLDLAAAALILAPPAIPTPARSLQDAPPPPPFREVLAEPALLPYSDRSLRPRYTEKAQAQQDLTPLTLTSALPWTALRRSCTALRRLVVSPCRL